jgi:uncharacterized membrane protein
MKLPDFRAVLLQNLSLFVASGLGLVLVAVHRIWTDGGGFGFLLWNLFLAWIPVPLAGLTLRLFRTPSGSARWMAGIAWLLFFPNAPYLLTDLVHWTHRTGAPPWVDLLILAHFGGLGVWLGFESLSPLHRRISHVRGATTGWAFAVGCLVLAGLGVYIGRFLRWNTWDIVVSPIALITDVASRLLRPDLHPRAWGFTLLFGSLLACGYWTTHRDLSGRLDADRINPS